jgi:hypothetical protein
LISNLAVRLGDVGGDSLQGVDHLRYANSRNVFHEEGSVVGLSLPLVNRQLVNRQLQRLGFPTQPLLQPSIRRLDQEGTSRFGPAHDLVLQTEYGTRVFAAPLTPGPKVPADRKLIQPERPSANAESLFRCRLKSPRLKFYGQFGIW